MRANMAPVNSLFQRIRFPLLDSYDTAMPQKKKRCSAREHLFFREQGKSENQTPAELEHAHAARAGNLAEGAGAAQVRTRIVEIDEVEDVGGFAAELELNPLTDGEVAEQRGIHILVAGTGERASANQPVESGGAAAGRASGRSRPAIDAGVEPFGHLVLPRTVAPEQTLGRAGQQVGPVVVHAVHVIVVAAGDGEWVAAVHGKRGGDGPSVEDMARKWIVALKIIRLPNAGDPRLIAHVIRLKLPLQAESVVIFRLRGTAVADVAGGL